MAFTFLLIHSQVLGPYSWRLTGEALEKRGHRVVIPNLAPAFTGGPPFYAKAAELLGEGARASRAADIVVVAHGAGGVLLPAAIGAAAPIPCRAGIFVDAIMPHPDRAWFDTEPSEVRAAVTSSARQGKVPNFIETGDAAFERALPDKRHREQLAREAIELPLAFFDEPAPSNDPVKGVPIGYLQLSEAYKQQHEDATWMKWRTRQELIGTYAMLTAPDRVAAALDQLTIETVASR